MKMQPPQDKAVRIISFKGNSYDVRENDEGGLFKISDYIKMLIYLFVKDLLTNRSISSFQNEFYKSENLPQYNTRHAEQNSVILTQ